jgi:hypothetical protein
MPPERRSLFDIKKPVSVSVDAALKKMQKIPGFEHVQCIILFWFGCRRTNDCGI